METATAEPKTNDLSIEDLEDSAAAEVAAASPPGGKGNSRKKTTARNAQTKPPAPTKQPARAVEPASAPSAPAPSELHPCGLPHHMVGRNSRKAIVDYVTLHGLSHEERQAMEITPRENEQYKVYKNAAPAVKPDRKMVIGAMRLWANGYPEKRDKRPHINTMKLNK